MKIVGNKIYIYKTDGIDEIQKAFMKQNVTIEFEKAVYQITKPLYLNTNYSHIIGNGARLRQAGYIHNILMSYTTSFTTKYNGIHDVLIDGLEFEGMSGKYNTKLNLLTLWHCKDITIKNCTFYDGAYFHDIELNGCSDIIIKNNKFLGYRSDVKEDYREYIQIDFSSESAIFLHKTKSKCYDLTHCKNITIDSNVFDKSSSRKANSNCIGNHCQAINGLKHDNIKIINNKMIGFGTNINGVAIRLTAMDNVLIKNNYISGYGRGVLIENKETSYDANGNKITAKGKDGICNNVVIEDNTMMKHTSKFQAYNVFVKSVTACNHANIVRRNNKVK